MKAQPSQLLAKLGSERLRGYWVPEDKRYATVSGRRYPVCPKKLRFIDVGSRRKVWWYKELVTDPQDEWWSEFADSLAGGLVVLVGPENDSPLLCPIKLHERLPNIQFEVLDRGQELTISDRFNASTTAEWNEELRRLRRQGR